MWWILDEYLLTYSNIENISKIILAPIILSEEALIACVNFKNPHLNS